MTTHVPGADLDKLSDASECWFLDEENTKAKMSSKVCDECWKESEDLESYDDNCVGEDEPTRQARQVDNV